MNRTKSQIYIITQGEEGATQIIILLAVNCNKFILLDNSFAQNPLKPKHFCYIIANINVYIYETKNTNGAGTPSGVLFNRVQEKGGYEICWIKYSQTTR